MNDKKRRKSELMEENSALKRKIRELEQAQFEPNRNEEELRETQEIFSQIMEHSPFYVFVKDDGIRSIRLSRNYEKMLGRPIPDLLGKTVDDLFPSDLAKSMKADDLKILHEGKPIEVEEELNGRIYMTVKFPIHYKRKARYLAGYTVDITDRKRAEKELRESEQKIRAIFDQTFHFIGMLTPDGTLIEANRTAMQFAGINESDCIGKPFWDTPWWTHSADMQNKLRKAIIDAARGEVVRLEVTHPAADGSIHDIDFSLKPVKDEIGKIIFLIAEGLDITERKQTEKALTDSEEKFRKIFYISPDPVSITRLEDGMYIMVNQALTRTMGYTEAELIGKTTIECNAWNNIEDRQRMVAGLKENGVVINLENNFRTKEGEILYGLTSATVIDLNGVQCSLSITRDITQRIQTEEQLRESLKQVRQAVATTVQVLVLAVEGRDPYTSGHQQRTTDLARSIATEMHLSPEMIEGIRLAGFVHDLGKITIPSEILSKPSKLSENEFALVKRHAWIGYNILKDVKSPWPLADIVYQHHERMDGSGYPRRLRGEEIIMEARIMAVADVVEAMSSHRPYRPALGIGIALEEIEKNKGTLYDAAVVDVCLRLFREEGFQFKST
jgi:PAS domain S-box-containing protein